MGISIGHNWSCSTFDEKPRVVEKVVQAPPPNPNPKRFYIQNYSYNGRYLIVLVNYPDCTNYEGNKILLFENVSFEELRQQGSIDPHFSENQNMLSPIARFVPTLRGWEMAHSLADALGRKR